MVRVIEVEKTQADSTRDRPVHRADDAFVVPGKGMLSPYFFHVQV